MILKNVASSTLVFFVFIKEVCYKLETIRRNSCRSLISGIGVVLLDCVKACFYLDVDLFTLVGVLFTLAGVLFTLADGLFILADVLFTLEDVLFTLDDVLFTLEYALFTLEYALFTLEDVLFTLDDVLFTLVGTKSETSRSGAQA